MPREAQVVTHRRSVATRLQRGSLVEGRGEVPICEVKCRIETGEFNARGRVHGLREPALPTRVIEQSEVVVGAHPCEVREIERRIERQSCRRPLQNHAPIEPGIRRAGRTREGQVRIRK